MADRIYLRSPNLETRIGVLRIGITVAAEAPTAGLVRWAARNSLTLLPSQTARTPVDEAPSGRRAIHHTRHRRARCVFARTATMSARVARTPTNRGRGRDVDRERGVCAREGHGRDGGRAQSVHQSHGQRGRQARDADPACVRDQRDRWRLGRRDRPENRPADFGETTPRTVARLSPFRGSTSAARTKSTFERVAGASFGKRGRRRVKL